jgi:hypothetical protein
MARSLLRCICEQLTAVLIFGLWGPIYGQGRMYLHKGWENFAIVHNVDFGCFIHFKYEGDNVLTVKVFEEQCAGSTTTRTTKILTMKATTM